MSKNILPIKAAESSKILSPKESKFSSVAHTKAVKDGPTNVALLHTSKRMFPNGGHARQSCYYSKQEAILRHFAQQWRSLDHFK